MPDLRSAADQRGADPSLRPPPGLNRRPATLHEAFEAHAKATPAAPAVLFGDREVSYAELDGMANRLARRLREMGEGEDRFVAVCVRRSVETLAAMLSVLKAGAAFVPLDPADPPQRIQAVIDDAQSRVVLAAHQDRHRFGGTETLWLESTPDRDGEMAAAPRVRPEHAACAYYTSGSTGEPKGVVLEHGGLLNKLSWADQVLLGRRALVMPVVSRLGVAASHRQLFVPWLRGGPVWLLDDRVAGDPIGLLGALSGQPQAALSCVPHLWEAMLEAAEAGLASLPDTLVAVFLGGESPSQSLIDRSFAALPDIELWNIYSATEIGTALAARLRPGERLQLGEPITHVQAHVLDGDLRPVSAEEVGELHIGGAGLARGYLGCPALTEERFIPDQFSEQPGGRLFKTGDLARRRADGGLEFVVRGDRLMKIMGFRIDPHEVEEAIREHPGLARCAVTASRDDRGRDRLVAHVVPIGGSSPTLTELRDFLNSRLPAYMLPSHLVVLDALLTTPSGKIDRQALPVPDAEHSRAEHTIDAPSNELEHWVVKLWERVLDVDSVGMTDDFFELGGDSLSALLLVEQVQRQIGAELSPSVLLEASTPERLAKLIARSRPGQRPSPLVAVRPNGSRTPFFCVAPIPATTLLPVRRLGRHLDPERPLYVLQSYGLDADGGAPLQSVAASYVSAIRSVQPHGPYLLGGQCFGSAIALEAAQQLDAQGEVVSLLVVFDGPPPPARTRVESPLARHAEDRGQRWRQLRHKGERLARRALRNPRRSLNAFWNALRDARELGTKRRRTIVSLYRRRRRWALFEWPAAEPHPGPICHFLSTDLRARTDIDVELGWREIACGELEFVIVPATHHDLLAEPAVGYVADQLNRRLEAAEAAAEA